MRKLILFVFMFLGLGAFAQYNLTRDTIFFDDNDDTLFRIRYSGTTLFLNQHSINLSAGVGDMTKAVYDPTNINSSAFARANMTGTQTAATISDFDAEVTNNVTVVANTAKVTNATHTGDVAGATALTIGADKVNDTHIDWGTGANQVSTADVPENTNLYYTEARVTANASVTANTAKETNATHTGDVAGATGLTIGNDKVLEQHLKSVNAPTDEYGLTYESTTGDFEWQALSSGDVSKTGTPVDNQVAVFTDANTIEGDAQFVYNKATNGLGIGTPQIRTADALTLKGYLRGQTHLTDATSKKFIISVGHYQNAEPPVLLLSAGTYSSLNSINYGGGDGSFNAATKLQFFTAANPTTTTGTIRMIILGSGYIGMGQSTPTSLLHISDGGSYTDADGIKYGTGAVKMWERADDSLLVEADHVVFDNDVTVDGDLTLNGGLVLETTTKTTNYTTLVSDNVIFYDCSAGNDTLTLITAVGHTGQTYIIKLIDNDSNTYDLVIESAGGTIDGETEIKLREYDAINVVSNGTNWFIY